MGVLRSVVGEWGHSSSEEAVHRTFLEDTPPSGSGMERGRDASSIQEPDPVEEDHAVPVTTFVVDACMERHDRWPSSCPEPDYPVCTPLALEQENGSSEVTSTSAHNSDDCSAVE